MALLDTSSPRKVLPSLGPAFEFNSARAHSFQTRRKHRHYFYSSLSSSSSTILPAVTVGASLSSNATRHSNIHAQTRASRAARAARAACIAASVAISSSVSTNTPMQSVQQKQPNTNAKRAANTALQHVFRYDLVPASTGVENEASADAETQENQTETRSGLIVPGPGLCVSVVTSPPNDLLMTAPSHPSTSSTTSPSKYSLFDTTSHPSTSTRHYYDYYYNYYYNYYYTSIYNISYTKTAEYLARATSSVPTP